RNCDPTDPTDDHRGDYWDHVAFDPEHKLILAVVPGARTEENARAIVVEVAQRVGGDPPPLMTSDEYPAYAAAIEEVFSEPVPAPRPAATQAGTAAGRARAAVAGRGDLRDCAQAPGEQPRHRRGSEAGLRLPGGTGRPAGRVGGERPCEHLVRGAAERDRPRP